MEEKLLEVEVSAREILAKLDELIEGWPLEKDASRVLRLRTAVLEFVNEYQK